MGRSNELPIVKYQLNSAIDHDLQNGSSLGIVRESVAAKQFRFVEGLQVADVQLLGTLNEITFHDLHVCGARSILAADVGQLVERELAKYEEQQFGVILLEGQILLECGAHLFHNAELLCFNEALQHHANGHADVRFQDILAQMQTRVSLSHTDDAFYVTHCNRKRSSRKRFLAQLSVHFCNLVLINVLFEIKVCEWINLWEFFLVHTVNLGRIFSLAYTMY